jgi:hypothetical protein
MNNISQSLNSLKDKVDTESNDKTDKFESLQTSLRAKVRESSHTLELTKTVTRFLHIIFF